MEGKVQPSNIANKLKRGKTSSLFNNFAGSHNNLNEQQHCSQIFSIIFSTYDGQVALSASDLFCFESFFVNLSFDTVWLSCTFLSVTLWPGLWRLEDLFMYMICNLGLFFRPRTTKDTVYYLAPHAVKWKKKKLYLLIMNHYSKCFLNLVNTRILP